MNIPMSQSQKNTNNSNLNSSLNFNSNLNMNSVSIPPIIPIQHINSNSNTYSNTYTNGHNTHNTHITHNTNDGNSESTSWVSSVDANATSGLTLIRLRAWMQEPLDRMCIMARLVDSAAPLTGGNQTIDHGS